jgi:PAS domain-containing protein
MLPETTTAGANPGGHEPRRSPPREWLHALAISLAVLAVVSFALSRTPGQAESLRAMLASSLAAVNGGAAPATPLEPAAERMAYALGLALLAVAVLLFTAGRLSKPDTRTLGQLIDHAVKLSAPPQMFGAAAAGVKEESAILSRGRLTDKLTVLLEMLHAQRRTMAEFLECLPLGAAVIADDARLVAANGFFCRMIEAAPGQVEGRGLEEAIPRAVAALIAPMIQGGGNVPPRKTRRVLVEHDGRKMRATVATLGGENGCGTLRLLLLEDIGGRGAGAPGRVFQPLKPMEKGTGSGTANGCG